MAGVEAVAGGLPIGVSYDSGPSIAADFTKVLESYRARADKVDLAVNLTSTGVPGVSAQQTQMLRQLTDLYNYAVETQIMVRTANQATTGFRQLVTGQ